MLTNKLLLCKKARFKKKSHVAGFRNEEESLKGFLRIVIVYMIYHMYSHVHETAIIILFWIFNMIRTAASSLLFHLPNESLLKFYQCWIFILIFIRCQSQLTFNGFGRIFFIKKDIFYKSRSSLKHVFSTT